MFDPYEVQHFDVVYVYISVDFISKNKPAARIPSSQTLARCHFDRPQTLLPRLKRNICYLFLFYIYYLDLFFIFLL